MIDKNKYPKSRRPLVKVMRHSEQFIDFVDNILMLIVIPLSLVAILSVLIKIIL